MAVICFSFPSIAKAYKRTYCLTIFCVFCILKFIANRYALKTNLSPLPTPDKIEKKLNGSIRSCHIFDNKTMLPQLKTLVEKFAGSNGLFLSHH